jgi:hypothetical protein
VTLPALAIVNEMLSYNAVCKQAVYERVARGMLHADRLTFALLLCRIHLKGTGAADTLEQPFAVFLRGKEGLVAHAPPAATLSSPQHAAAARLAARYGRNLCLCDSAGLSTLYHHSV